MKIYQQEILDGLEQSIATSNTIACVAVAEKCEPASDIAVQKANVAKALEFGNPDQIDLFYMRSILVSTGWNKNDDVFDSEELWKARHTPTDKPFNFMHNEKDIIGHITGNQVVDFDGNDIPDNMTEVPHEFNILTTAVVYTAWSEPEQKERMDKIVAEIEEGKWFVSMECLFPEFDYALVSPEGETRVVKRSEASAFLTKHLRAYGGTGSYQNYQVGRLLRNLSFSGKGLVSKPANPRSVILEGNATFVESMASALDVNFLKENNMSDELNKQISDLQVELTEAKAARESEVAEAAAKIAELEATVESLNATIASKDEEISTLSGSTVAMDEEKEGMMEMIKKYEEELAGYRKYFASMKRKAELEEAGLDSEAALAAAEDFSDTDDDTFGRILAALKKTLQSVSVATEVVEDVVAEEVVAEEKAELEEEVDSSEASEADLDTVEVEASAEVAVAEVAVEGEAESLRAVASEWLGSVLRSENK